MKGQPSPRGAPVHLPNQVTGTVLVEPATSAASAGAHVCVAVSRVAAGRSLPLSRCIPPSSFRFVLISLRADLKLPQVPLGGQFSWARKWQAAIAIFSMLFSI